MHLTFDTPRLRVSEISAETTLDLRNELLQVVPHLLSPAVVESLPPHFHNIKSNEQANSWLQLMLEQSRVFVASSSQSKDVIGMMFVYPEQKKQAHIGYLLAETHWGQGLAGELLSGFIEQIARGESWLKLVAGVDKGNLASIRLLTKMGFVEQNCNEHEQQVVTFYQLDLE